MKIKSSLTCKPGEKIVRRKGCLIRLSPNPNRKARQNKPKKTKTKRG